MHCRNYRIAGNFRWCKFSNNRPKYLENIINFRYLVPSHSTLLMKMLIRDAVIIYACVVHACSMTYICTHAHIHTHNTHAHTHTHIHTPHTHTHTHTCTSACSKRRGRLSCHSYMAQYQHDIVSQYPLTNA